MIGVPTAESLATGSWEQLLYQGEALAEEASQGGEYKHKNSGAACKAPEFLKGWRIE